MRSSNALDDTLHAQDRFGVVGPIEEDLLRRAAKDRLQSQSRLYRITHDDSGIGTEGFQSCPDHYGAVQEA